MAMSSLTYIPGFSVNSFVRSADLYRFLQIGHILIKDHILCSPLKLLNQIKPNMVGMTLIL
jgi:hypothetical protein